MNMITNYPLKEEEKERFAVRCLKERIKFEKSHLRQQARKRGICENFGQNACRQLEVDYDLKYFTIHPLRGQVVILLNEFKKWCEEFDLSQI